MFIMKVTSEFVNMQELSMLCMDWVSGTPRGDRVTKSLFYTTKDTKTAYVHSDIWDRTVIKLSKADAEAIGKVRPAYANLAKVVDESPSINLKTLCEALNSASGGKVSTVKLDISDGSFIYPE